VQLTIISVGKIGEPFLKEGFQLYGQRVQRYAPLRILCIPEERIQARGKTEYICKKESQRIREKLPREGLFIALDAKGKEFSSEMFSRNLGKWMASGLKEVAFVLGGPYGLDEALKNEAHLCLSLSPMTLPHGLAKIVLLEQIYRAFTLLRGEPYHK
jgi:23S rRNA (pseudouridine1915-N3)-methyltransferase